MSSGIVHVAAVSCAQLAESPRFNASSGFPLRIVDGRDGAAIATTLECGRGYGFPVWHEIYIA
jgi:hypothetical protein